MSEESDGEVGEVSAEENRNIDLAFSLLRKNTGDCIIVYTTKTDGFAYATENRTWAMGALRRAAIALDEMEKIDTRRDSDGI